MGDAVHYSDVKRVCDRLFSSGCRIGRVYHGDMGLLGPSRIERHHSPPAHPSDYSVDPCHLGLFLLAINAVVVLLASDWVEGFTVHGFWAALAFSMVMTLVSSVLEGNVRAKVVRA